jgi:hypothetical protein
MVVSGLNFNQWGSISTYRKVLVRRWQLELCHEDGLVEHERDHRHALKEDLNNVLRV